MSRSPRCAHGSYGSYAERPIRGDYVTVSAPPARAASVPASPHTVHAAYARLTTIAGFGSLLVAHHQGVASLGMLLVIGTVTCLVASLVVLPVLLRAASRD